MSIFCICCGDNKSVSLKYKPEAHFYDSTTTFDYYYCNKCDMLWRDQRNPIDLIQYDHTYYSFNSQSNWIIKLKTALHSILFNLYYYFSFSFLETREYILFRVFRKLKLPKSFSILDVGCGGGAFLDRLYSYGYKNIQGIDPYAKSSSSSHFTIRSITISDVTNQFNVINAHHVLEHAADPHEFLKEIYRCLLPEGIAILTFPRFSKVLEEDGDFSYLLQAPDHNTLLSDKCFRTLCSSIGFNIEYFEIDASGTFNWLVIGALWRKKINVKGYNKKYLPYLSEEERNQLNFKANQLINNGDGGNILYIIKK